MAAAKKPNSKPKSKRGGSRVGAGRKTAADKALRENFQAIARDLIVDELPGLVGNLVSLAKGVKTTNKEGGVYTTLPDREANKYLLDRVLGRPMQAVEHSGKDGAALVNVQVYLPDNGRARPASTPDLPAQLAAAGAVPVDAG